MQVMAQETCNGKTFKNLYALSTQRANAAEKLGHQYHTSEPEGEVIR
ncbi:hypothetical protein [Thermoleptolyngbya sp.]|jgi:NifU-like protein involved in Fe-S cluster formation